MRPAQAAAGCVVARSAATNAAIPVRNRLIPASTPAMAGMLLRRRWTRLVPEGGPGLGQAGSAEAGRHHREENERADRELDETEPPDTGREFRHLRGSGGVAARGARSDLDEPIGPPRDRRSRERVDPDREDDPGEERPRPPRGEPGELLRAPRGEQVEETGEDREFGDAKDVFELPRDEVRHDAAAHGRRAGEGRRG